MNSSLVAAIIAVVCLSGLAEGLKCYQCEHVEGSLVGLGFKSDKSCATGKSPKDDFLVDCPDKFAGVGILCGKTVGKNGGDKGTIRGCYLNTDNASGCKSGASALPTYVKVDSKSATNYTVNAVEIDTCVCDKDKCNSSSMTSVSLLTFFVALCLSKFM